MTAHSIPVIVMATVAFYVGTYHLFLFLRRRQSRQDLTFALTCLGVGVYDVLCVGLYNATSVAEGVEWQRWQLTAMQFVGITFIFFVADYAHHKSRKICFAFSACFLLVGIVGIIDRSELTWLNQPNIKHIELPLSGNEITYYEMAPGIFTSLFSVVALSMFVYALSIGVRLYQSGERQRAWPLLSVIAVFFAGVANDAAVLYGLYQSPYTTEYAFLGIVVVMAYALSEELVAATRVRQALHDSEEKFRSLFESSADAILLVDPERGYLDGNPAALKMFAISSRKKLRSLGPAGLSPPDQPDGSLSAERVTVETVRALKDGTNIIEWTYRALDGREFPAIVLASRLELDGRTILQGTIRDITEQNRAERALRESEARFRGLIESSSDWIWEVDAEGVYTYASPQVEEMLGYTPQEIVGRTPFDLMPPDKGPQLREIFNALMETAEPINALENTILHKNGRHVILETSGVPVCEESGRVTGYRGVDRDITERKQAEKELVLQKQFSEALLNSMPGMFYVYDEKGRLLQWNKNHETLTGYSADELSQMHLLDWFDGDHQARVAQALAQTISEGETIIEAPLIAKDGRRIPYLFTGSRFRWGGGWLYMGMGIDISERKRAEEALRENESKLREAQQLAHLGNWYWDVKSGAVEWSREVYTIFRLDPEEFTPQIDSIMALSPWPGEHERNEELIREAVESHEPGFYEQRSLRPDGSIGYYSSTFQGVYDSDGSVTALKGTVQDITERKRAEEALAKRIVALTRPLDDTEGVLFEDLFSVHEIQRLQDEFARATGVASIIARTDGTAITTPSNFCRLCKDIIRKTEKGLANCQKSDAALIHYNLDGPTFQPCLSGGLWDASAAICIGGKHIASWMIGQVRDETQTEEEMREYAREIGADEEIVIEAFHEIPAMSHGHFQEIAQALFTLANQLSTTAYQNVQQARFITDRKEAETELRRLRNYLSNIIDSMPSILVGVDADGTVTQWNAEAERTTGVSPKEAVGRSLSQAFPRLANEMERVREAMRNRQTLTDSQQARQEDGETRYENVTVYPLVANGVEGAVIRVDDVTERVRIEEMMIQTEKMMSVGGLAAGMAHEINNPLAGILQNVQVMRNRLSCGLSQNDAAAEACGTTMEVIEAYMGERGIPDMVESVLDSGKRAAKIVDNMLSFARKSDATFSTHDLAELLDQTRDMAGSDYDLKKKFDFRQIEIVRDYEDNLPLVPCEAGKIQQVLLNVLRNGAEAMHEVLQKEEGSRPRFVLRLAYERQAERVRIEIEDNGPGMDEDTRKRVFEPFFTTKPTDRGTGLGLSVSYFIITEHHHGRMAVESSPGQGAKFIIHLPVEREQA